MKGNLSTRWLAYSYRGLEPLVTPPPDKLVLGQTGYACRKVVNGTVEYYRCNNDLISELYLYNIALSRWWSPAPLASFWATVETIDETFLHEIFHQIIMLDKMRVLNEEDKVNAMAIKLAQITAGRTEEVQK